MSLKVRKCECFHSVPADVMIKPLRRFITATPLGALMSLTLQHPLQYPSLSISNTDVPSVLLPCSVCHWSWVNKWVFLSSALQIDLLAQTIYSCSALAKWVGRHWSINTACHLGFTWFSFFFSPFSFLSICLMLTEWPELWKVLGVELFCTLSL